MEWELKCQIRVQYWSAQRDEATRRQKEDRGNLRFGQEQGMVALSIGLSHFLLGFGICPSSSSITKREFCSFLHGYFLFCFYAVDRILSVMRVHYPAPYLQKHIQLYSWNGTPSASHLMRSKGSSCTRRKASLAEVVGSAVKSVPGAFASSSFLSSLVPLSDSLNCPSTTWHHYWGIATQTHHSFAAEVGIRGNISRVRAINRWGKGNTNSNRHPKLANEMTVPRSFCHTPRYFGT